MDISSLYNIGSSYIQSAASESSTATDSTDASFDSVFRSVIGNLNETNELSNQAEQEEIKMSLGLSENTHDLTIAQEKATTALQYTVAVRDRFLDAYKEIMNMQI